MDFINRVILPLGVAAIVGACAPYPPAPYPAPTQPETEAEGQPALTDEEQRQIEENRQRLEREEAERRNAQGDLPARPDGASKPKYPTAAVVPGKPGFVFNPYTHNIVDVKGIASGKLCRDPEDPDPSHKFRVP